MTYALAYWIILMIWIVFGLWSNRANLKAAAPDLVILVLFILIGLQIFGKPIHQ